MRYLALFRHGHYQQQPDTPSAWQPWPLTAQGYEQCRAGAEQLRTHVASLGLDLTQVIHSSTLLRARQTASALAEELDLPVEHIRTTDRLTERSVGSAANLTLAQIESAIAADPDAPPLPEDWKRDPHYRLPLSGAESLTQAGLRVAAYLQSVVEPQDPDSITVVVGHGASIRHACAALGIFSAQGAGTVSMYHAMPVILGYETDLWSHVAGDWKPRTQEEQVD